MATPIKERLRRAKNKGVGHLAKKFIEVPLRETGHFFVLLYLKVLSRATFNFEGTTLPYEYHSYNTAWSNERTIEIPIGRHIVQTAEPGSAILEIGNTLKHYHDYAGDVVDKYEVEPGVMNIDVDELDLGKKYDYILSLSTMEHVGFDEDIKDPGKIRRSLNALVRHLKPGGKMVVTMPLGYNPTLDDDIRNNRLPFNHAVYMKRLNAKNDWQQVDRPVWEDIRYGYPYRGGNWIIIGMVI